ncbi:MAG: hypothetical protein ACQSGP_00190 [Frankia sp.]
MQALRRTTPFIAQPRELDVERVILVDRVEAKLTAAENPAFTGRLRASLALGPRSTAIGAAEAERLVGAHYEACLEHVFGHPLWGRLRSDGAPAALLAYLLETRHYLAAAPYRMAPGIGPTLSVTEPVRLAAHHVVEEAEHDVYFEKALVSLGCAPDLIRAARPSPVTVEWIQVMRAVSELGPVPAALCSGLLESTAADTSAVARWHEMLAETGQLARPAVDAIFEHVATDLGLGHGANWRTCLRAVAVITADDLAAGLNAVSVVAEMIARWLDSVLGGWSASVVELMRAGPVEVPSPVTNLAGELDGLPVWPAEVLDRMTRGADPGDGSATGAGVARVIAAAYAFGGRAVAVDQEPGPSGDPGAGTTAPRDLVSAAAAFTRRVTAAFGPAVTRGPWPPAAHKNQDGAAFGLSGYPPADLAELVTGWMRAIDGHRLWRAMIERPDLPLVYGWLAENYHYIASIWQHTGAAVASCSDPQIRAWLVRHLTEEFHHATLLGRGLDDVAARRFDGLLVASTRPLPTTVAFTGALRGLAQRDWRAYVLGLAFLQLSLRVEAGGAPDPRHEAFYRAVATAGPDVGTLLDGMRRHDHEDTRLGHGDDTRDLLTLLAERQVLTADSIASAALVAQLSWSFLDGIWSHYRWGPAAVVQRMGWHVTEPDAGDPRRPA